MQRARRSPAFEDRPLLDVQLGRGDDRAVHVAGGECVPEHRDAVDEPAALVVDQARTASISRVPDTAPEPNSERPKRALPSAQSTTETDTGSSTPSRCRSAAPRRRRALKTAVEPAAVGYRVEMAAEHDPLGRVPGSVTTGCRQGRWSSRPGCRRTSTRTSHGRLPRLRPRQPGAPEWWASDGTPPTVCGSADLAEVNERSSRRSLTTR